MFFTSSPGVLPRGVVFIHGGDTAGERGQSGMVLSCCRPRGTGIGKKSTAAIRKNQRSRWPSARTSAQERVLKMQLKIHRRTLTAKEDGLEMFHRLQQRLGLRALGRGLSAAEPGSHRIQASLQFPLQAIKRFQCKRQPHCFGSGFQRKSRQQLHQPLPHQRGRQRMPWQNPRQKKGKGAPTTAALSAVGAKHPLAPASFSVSGVGIIAQRTAMPVQRAATAAMRTRRLLEGKSLVFNSCASRTK
jgi:hypothetical protein